MTDTELLNWVTKHYAWVTHEGYENEDAVIADGDGPLGDEIWKCSAGATLRGDKPARLVNLEGFGRTPRAAILAAVEVFQREFPQ